MRITGFEVITVDIPLRMSVDHALAKRKHARNILVRADSDAGQSGWGECCPREYVTGESIASVREELAKNILPRLVGQEFDSLETVTAHLTAILDELARNQQAAFCAAELAVLDLVGRATDRSAGDVLGPVVQEQARYSGVLATADPDEVKERCGFMRKFGVDAVKIKTVITLDENLQLLEIAREILGPDVRFRLDANAAWDADETIRQLEAMAAFGIEGIEQPVPADDFAGMQAVTAAGLAPVVADESLCSLEDAKKYAEGKGCDIFNIRVSKCGGLINAGRIKRVADEAGLRCQLGAQVGETGILSAAGRQFATRCSPIWCEGSYGGLLLEEDITDPDVTVGPGGFAPALTAPGLGVDLLLERVEARRVDSFNLPS